MKGVVHLLPELTLGGVERHVVDLTAQQVSRHPVAVVSGGGPLVDALAPGVEHLTLPVGEKNLFTALGCSRRLKAWAKERGYTLAHAHSRVPLWVAWFARGAFEQVVMTCHATYSKNFGLWPLKRIDGAICISEAVKDHLQGFLPPHVAVVTNGVAQPKLVHDACHQGRLLFVGRLTRLKGLDTALKALAQIELPFTLDVVGDGPQSDELKELARSLGLAVNWHGALSEERVEELMAHSSLLLAPSRQEGFSLVRSRAAAIGLPLMLSDIPANREAVIDASVLLPPDDVQAWRGALRLWLARGKGACSLKEGVLRSLKAQADDTEAFYALLRKSPC